MSGALAADATLHIAVDLDGTIARYETQQWQTGEIGPPIEAMVRRVRRWLTDGHAVTIFTARANSEEPDRDAIIADIQAWCKQHVGVVLPVTAEKHYRFDEYYDDRAVQCERNTGRLMCASTRGLVDP